MGPQRLKYDRWCAKTSLYFELNREPTESEIIDFIPRLPHILARHWELLDIVSGSLNWEFGKPSYYDCVKAYDANKDHFDVLFEDLQADLEAKRLAREEFKKNNPSQLKQMMDEIFGGGANNMALVAGQYYTEKDAEEQDHKNAVKRGQCE